MQSKSRLARTVVVLFVALIMAGGCFEQQVKRVGSVIGIPKNKIGEYKRLHADTWPAVLKVLRESNVTNYSIYLGDVEDDERYYLFSYFEYTGDDYEKDMAEIGKAEAMRKWWTLTDPLQKPLPTRKEGEWWAEWEEVFHHDGPLYEESEIRSRHGAIIGLRQDAILAYTQLHAAVWPGVLAAIERANIRNYSIYLGEVTPDEHVLFAYYEYIGDDFEADMAKMADEVTKIWWTYTDPLQIRLPGTPEGEQWKAIRQLFHMD